MADRTTSRPPDPRFRLANERTFLAWNRTALTLIGGGLAAAQILKSAVSGSLSLGLPLIVLGAAVSVAGGWRWRANERALRAGRRVPGSRVAPALVGLGTAAMAVLAIVLIVVHEVQR